MISITTDVIGIKASGRLELKFGNTVFKPVDW